MGGLLSLEASHLRFHRPRKTNKNPVPRTLRPLDPEFTNWLIKSQKVKDLYSSGAKLWTKGDLEDIEQQLSQSYSMERFSVRRIDGSVIQILNPLFQVKNPMWKPYVRYRGYWEIVKVKPIGPVEISICSYIVGWINQTELNSPGLIEQPTQVFDERYLVWQNSKTWKHLAAMVQKALGESTVKKVLCFGLGDFCRAVPEWLEEEYGSMNQSSEGKDVQDPVIQRSMFQHSMALTIAQLCGSNASLLTQEPQYAKLTEDILTQKGFKIIGTHGAGGFAEADENSIVISPYATAPVKQIIADVTRPLLIISLGIGFCDDEENQLIDAESPRTKQMWIDYDVSGIPSYPEEVEICSALKGLHLYCRRQKHQDS